MSEIDNLIADVFDDRRRGVCWAARVTDPDAQEFIRRVAEESAKGHRPVWRKLARALRQFGIERGERVVSDHFKGNCSCYR